jgi:CRP-like cAMP-binding protein
MLFRSPPISFALKSFRRETLSKLISANYRAAENFARRHDDVRFSPWLHFLSLSFDLITDQKMRLPPHVPRGGQESDRDAHAINYLDAHSAADVQVG